MVKPATVELMLIVLLVAWSASMLVSAGDAAQAGQGEVGRTSGGAESHVYHSPEHKMNWLTRSDANAPEPPLLAVSVFVACVVLVALLAAGLIYQGRKHATIDS